MTRILRLGTRGSRLALWQAESVRDQLQQRGFGVELVPITTSGDVQTAGPVASLGSVGVFTKEIQRALLEDKIDLAVHSMKDLPTDVVPGLTLAAVPLRGDVRDVWVSRKFPTPLDAPPNVRVGTGSLRRKAQLIHRLGAEVEVEPIRGNVETRLAKLDSGEFDALVLAVAGLSRLALDQWILPGGILPPDEFLPAVGQGALAIETRGEDTETLEAVATMDDAPTRAQVLAERSMLAALTGGCLAPIGAYSMFADDRLILHGCLLTPDGIRRIDAIDSIPYSDAVNAPQIAAELGRAIANKLLSDSR